MVPAIPIPIAKNPRRDRLSRVIDAGRRRLAVLGGALACAGGYQLRQRQLADDGVHPVPAGPGGCGGGVLVVLVHGPSPGGHDAPGDRRDGGSR